jgi:ABC-type nitrate/sulfonate/bicarbonate transport system permease component
MYINALYVTSLEALLPFIILLFGTKLPYRVVVVVLFSVFFIIINTMAGIRSVSPQLLETARSFCIPRHKLLTSILLPSVLPYVIAGMRLGLGNAIKGMIVAELWVTVDTGRKLVDLSYSHDLPGYFAIAFWIMLFGTLSTRLMMSVQRRLTPWAADVRGVRKREV